MGIEVDHERNAAAVARESVISTDRSTVKALVIPTNEELIIARDTVRLVEAARQPV
jgi:acetate kinase